MASSNKNCVDKGVIPNQDEDAGFGMWKRLLRRERNCSAMFGNVTAKKVVIASRNSFAEVS